MNTGEIINLPELADAAGIPTHSFRIVDIMAGGMGTCLKLQHTGHETAFAVKLIRPELMENDLAWHRFYEELKLCFTLSESSGVVESICLARLNEIPCLCSPWMKGGTLRNKMRVGDCSPDFVFRALARVLHTLDWVNKKHKAVHRDLKPENILLDENGLAYVSDWGLAKLIDKQLRQANSKTATEGGITQPEATQAGSFLGTIFYASPEQILGQPGIDLRSDIYSLGCIMYELEAGKPPFTGRTVGEIATHHLRDKAPELGGGFFRRTNLGLEYIIERCLQKKPKDRFQDYDELLEEFIRAGTRKRIDLSEACPKMRARRPKVGGGEYHENILTKKQNEGARYQAVELSDIEPYLDEVNALMALGQWQKALDILITLYIPKLATPEIKWNVAHAVAVNYAYCLIKAGNPARACEVLDPLAGMPDLVDTYYVNYSLALLHTHSFIEAEGICKIGLAKYPDDKDLIGNYLISLQAQDKISEALSLLDARLHNNRNVHSLEEAAHLMMLLADEYGEQDWTHYTTNIKKAIGFLLEARQQNPRFISTRYNLALALYLLEQHVDAAKEFWEAAHLAGNNNKISESAVSYIGQILLETGSYKECVSFCQEWMPKLKDSTRLNRTMAMAIAEGWYSGKDGKLIVVPESIEFFEKAIKGVNPQVEDFCYLAELYARMKKDKEAEYLFKQAEDKFSKHWLIPYYKGLVKNLEGQKEDALQFLRLASQLAPFRSEPEWKMGQIYCGLGNEDMGDCMKRSSEEKKIKRKAIAEDGLSLA